MLRRAYIDASSSTPEALMQNVTNYALFSVVSITLAALLNLSFPIFLFETIQVVQRTLATERDTTIVRISIVRSTDQVPANAVRGHLRDLSHKAGRSV